LTHPLKPSIELARSLCDSWAASSKLGWAAVCCSVAHQGWGGQLGESVSKHRSCAAGSWSTPRWAWETHPVAWHRHQVDVLV